MNDFQGLLSEDYRFKPQGKSAPMAPPRSSASSAFDFGIGGTTAATTAPYSKSSSSRVVLDDDDDIFRPSNSGGNRKPSDFSNLGDLDYVFGGSSKSTGNSVNFDSVFSGMSDSGSQFSSLPVFDKPVYDDEAFDGVSGLKSSSSAKYEDVFSSSTSAPSKKQDAFDDILGELGRKKPESTSLSGVGRNNEKGVPAFDDLLPGFGPRRTPSDRPGSGWAQKSTVNETTKGTCTVEDPFVVLNSSSPETPSSPGHFRDPLEEFSKISTSSTKSFESVPASGVFDDIDPLDSLGESVPVNDKENIGISGRMGSRLSGRQTSTGVETKDRPSSVRSPERSTNKNMPGEKYHEFPRFDMYSASVDSSSYVNTTDETTFNRHTSSVYEDHVDSSDDLWLTVSEILLFTQPTSAPPPSRPPPPRPPRVSKAGAGSVAPPYAKWKVDNHSSILNSAQFFKSSRSAPMGVKNAFASPIDELENFAVGRSSSMPDGNSDVLSGDLETNSDAAASAAAMKEAMDRAEARFKHAKEVRERENAKAARMQQEKDEKSTADLQERAFRERHDRQEREWERELKEEEERKQRAEEERIHREMGEREKEQRRLERERIERVRVRQAVERATREARERAAAEARARAEKAAVEKVQAEARERAERAAVLRAQAEARERAARSAAEAKQRADREKAEREARQKAEREAKDKEARDRAAAASARTNQQKKENDLESFFNMGSRASSAPRPRASSSDPFFNSQFPNKQAEAVRTSVGSAASMRKASSSTNFFDDLNSILGGASSSAEFQEVEGETEERRKARLERHQRTQERAAKALAEKNQRDLEAQREQAERHRIAETLDIEIKRWAAGKEGNLRALLSTLQYVLWPECGWQPVSLTDLITATAVKKVYRKATLCIHPDKVQQKGATLRQKYIAEKVFDILKESWNKFNSEELF